MKPGYDEESIDKQTAKKMEKLGELLGWVDLEWDYASLKGINPETGKIDVMPNFWEEDGYISVAEVVWLSDQIKNRGLTSEYISKIYFYFNKSTIDLTFHAFLPDCPSNIRADAAIDTLS